MNKKQLILIGGGGHCKVVISILRKLGDFQIAGIVDNYKVGRLIKGINVIGGDEDLESLHKKGFRNAVITVGSIKDNRKRYELFNIIKKIGYKFPIIISSEAVIDTTVKIGEGTVVMPGCVINIDSSVGKNCIINTGAIVEHDCKIGHHCHIASGVHISGGVEIGDLSFIGIGSTIIQEIKIGKNVTLGAGSTVIEDIPDDVVVAGNPLKPVKSKGKEV